ncbi:ribonuclease E activity regulator RraA [Shouchella lonarensis]|uniref:4-hydroxy-4-methyl-2-oxoglutarate aldolase n=1 Tax=Shouchella lonarensis TaxID=1464122 RepID=A0A1G6MMB4_9BACI|nr:ribonuclease E activity regulator RraA [Shouchella lonarensis]SDC56652.1 regulator of ribonuclease activity A [Shouchella lonarensis]
MSFKTTDVCDDYVSELQILQPGIVKSFGSVHKFSGPITTVDVFEDNVLVKETLAKASPGNVIVVDGKGEESRCALLGDKVAQIAMDAGVVGIIINGYVRDTAELAAMNIGIYARGPLPNKSKKEGKGQVGAGVDFGGVSWRDGYYVYVDEDGIVLAGREL